VHTVLYLAINYRDINKKILLEGPR